MNMIIPRQSIIHCHPQEFCLGAVGGKIMTCIYLSGCLVYDDDRQTLVDYM
jgi:hypothetical protein